jgi:hypothetical protein
MIGWGIDITQGPSRLIVFTPINILMLLALGVFTIWPLLIFLRQKPMRRRRVIIQVLITLVVYGIFPSGSRVTLDRDAGTATVSRYFFYWWHTQTFPLDDLESAFVSTGSTTSKITLQFADGSVESLSELNQIGGKREAVAAINHFLRRS